MFIYLHSRKCIWKCHLENGGHLSRPQCVKIRYLRFGLVNSSGTRLITCQQTLLSSMRVLVLDTQIQIQSNLISAYIPVSSHVFYKHESESFEHLFASLIRGLFIHCKHSNYRYRNNWSVHMYWNKGYTQYTFLNNTDNVESETIYIALLPIIPLWFMKIHTPA